jgi:hypothetical protein
MTDLAEILATCRTLGRTTIVGYYRGKDLIYVARTRNGFVPASRRRVFEKLRLLVTPNCPFINLPETRKARWGEALTAGEDEEMCLGSAQDCGAD